MQRQREDGRNGYHQGRLGATFFFKRGEGDRGKMSKFFTAITSQLIQYLPEIAEYVQVALDANPSHVSGKMETQFLKLIIDPVSKISTDSSPRTFLFVIDALDDCEREEDVTEQQGLNWCPETNMAPPEVQ